MHFSLKLNCPVLCEYYVCAIFNKIILLMDLALVEKDQNFHVHEIKFQQAFTVASNQSMNPKDAILFAMCSTQ